LITPILKLRAFRSSAVLGGLIVFTGWAYAAEQSSVEQSSTVAGQSASSDVKDQKTGLSASELSSAQMWGISTQEMQRVSMLMKGPIGSFAVERISPIEVLGIYAKTDAERLKYAELFARAHVDSVKRSLAWSRVSEKEIKKLLGNTPVVSFEGAGQDNVNRGVAAGVNVPSRVMGVPKSPFGVVQQSK
jgi:hypothetical protein